MLASSLFIVLVLAALLVVLTFALADALTASLTKASAISPATLTETRPAYHAS
jgi:hypothetical protein